MSIFQSSPALAAVKIAPGDEHHQLAQWIWSVALRLKLHAHSQSVCPSGVENRDPPLIDVVDLTSDDSFGSIVRGLLEEAREPLAGFLALGLTKSGHWLDL